MPILALVFLIFALLLELLAAGWWFAPEPPRYRMIAAGLFCYFVMELLVRTGVGK